MGHEDGKDQLGHQGPQSAGGQKAIAGEEDRQIGGIEVFQEL